MGEGEWYYCMTHHRIEPYYGCKKANRLGPYATKEEAATALDLLAARNEVWETDPRFNDEEDEDNQGFEGWGSLPR